MSQRRKNVYTNFIILYIQYMFSSHDIFLLYLLVSQSFTIEYIHVVSYNFSKVTVAQHWLQAVQVTLTLSAEISSSVKLMLLILNQLIGQWYLLLVWLLAGYWGLRITSQRANSHQALNYSQGSQETSNHFIPTQQQSLNEPISFKHIYTYIVDQAMYVINKIDTQSTDIHTKLT